MLYWHHIIHDMMWRVMYPTAVWMWQVAPGQNLVSIPPYVWMVGSLNPRKLTVEYEALLHISEVPGSDLGTETGYPGW